MSFDCKNHSMRLIIWLCCLQMAHGQNETDQSGRILSRQRRYLIFPSGSSIQFGKLAFGWSVIVRCVRFVFFILQLLTSTFIGRVGMLHIPLRAYHWHWLGAFPINQRIPKMISSISTKTTTFTDGKTLT